MKHRAVETLAAATESTQGLKPTARIMFWLVFLPPLILGLLILKYGVDVMDWDQWKIAALFDKQAHGVLTLSDLFAQQGEFRQFFPNLIFLGLGLLTHWNIRYEMLVIFALACLVASNLYSLGRVTLNYSDTTRYVVALLSSLLIFSPAQYENWLHGEQVIYLMPAACLTTALRLSYSNWSFRTNVALCAVLSIIAAFSSPNGIVCWAVLTPVLFFARRPGGRRLDWIMIAWTIGFMVALFFYAYGYQKPAYSPPLDAALAHPVKTVFFFFALLGAPLLTTYRLGVVGAALGGTMLILYAVSFRVTASVQNEKARSSLLPWLALGAYAIVTAVIVTFARVGYGVDQAFSSRYGGFFVYLAVSLCWVAPAILRVISGAGRLRDLRFFGLGPGALCTAALILLHIANSAYAIQQMGAMRSKQLQAKACLMFVNVVDDDCLKRGFPALGVVKARTNAMNDLGYLRPRLIRNANISQIAAGEQLNPADGRFGRVVARPDGTLMASGKARLSVRGDPADAVLLTYDDTEGNPVVFGLAQATIPKPSFRRLLPHEPFQGSEWQRAIPAGMLPATRPIRISAWAFDALAGTAHRIEGDYVLVSEARAR